MRLAFATIVVFLASSASAQQSAAPADSPQSESRRLLDSGANFYHDGQIDKSLEAYERAIQLLAHQQRLDEAYSASMTAAAIERKAGRHTSAAERYRQLALNLPDHARAADAHRFAILSVADALRTVPPEQQLLLANAYENVLHEHLTHWPNGSTADDARLWLGRLFISRRDWPEARETLEEIDESKPQYGSAVLAIADSYRLELQQLVDTPHPEASRQQCAALVATATRQLLPVITGANNRWPEPWSDTQRHIAVTIAAMHLDFSNEPSPYAERLLTAALDSLPAEAQSAASDDSNTEWQARARSLLLVALVRNGKFSEASALARELTDAPSKSLVEAVARVDRAVNSLPATETGERRETATIALSLLRILESRRQSLDAETTTNVARFRATAAIASGDESTAIAEYAKLAGASPDDERLQIEYAALLMRSESPEHLRRALSVWQKVEEQNRGGTDSWRRARQSRIDLLDRLGQRDDAEKLRKLSEILYPDWNYPKSKQQ